MGAWSLAAASMIMLCISFNVEAVEGFSVPLAMALDPAPGMKIIVCQGSSCASPVPSPVFPGLHFCSRAHPPHPLKTMRKGQRVAA